MAGEFGGYQFSEVGVDGGEDLRLFDVQTSPRRALGHFRPVWLTPTISAVRGFKTQWRPWRPSSQEALGVAHSTGSAFARRSPILGILAEYGKGLR